MIVVAPAEWRSLAARGLVALTFGLITLAWPDISLHALVVLFGAYVMADGIVMLVDVIAGAPSTGERRGVLVVQAVASIGAGLVTFFWPSITALALLGVIAAWGFVIGVIEIRTAIRMHQDKTEARLLGISGVLAVVLAAVLIITPGAGALAITWAIGWYAALAGVLLLGVAWRLRQGQVRLESRSRSMRHGPATA